MKSKGYIIAAITEKENPGKRKSHLGPLPQALRLWETHPAEKLVK